LKAVEKDKVRTFNEVAERLGQDAHAASEIETTLTRLWAELLKVDLVGVDDDYFALGGNSLLAVTLMARVEADLGVKLPLTSIIEAPTVGEFARLMASRGSHSPVILIREGRRNPPLFFVHDADGETMIYRGLALRLETDRSVFGLKPYSKPNYPILQTQIEEMAAFHVATVRGIQSHGPYLLGGLCAGGVIAFEMACQLQRAGEQVAMVALLDGADVDAQEKPMRLAKERLTRLSSTLGRDEGQSGPRRALLTATRVARKARNFVVYAIKSRAQTIRDRTKMRLFHTFLKRGLTLPSFLEQISVRTAYGYARTRYRPATPFDGELSLVRATAGTGADEPYANRYVDPLLGWEKRATRGVRVLDAPGGHSSILQEPHVQVLARWLDQSMNEALQSPGSVVKPAENGSLESSLEPRRAATLEGADPAELVADPTGSRMRTHPLETRPSRPAQVLLISADNPEALAGGVLRIADWLDGVNDSDLPDASFTLAVSRPALPWRRAVVAASRTETIERLRKGSGKGVWTSAAATPKRPLAFVLAGVGEQAGGAGRGLYESEPAFRVAADQCAEILQPLMGLDIRNSMFTAATQAGSFLRGGDGGVLKQTRVAQPSAFVLDWALAQMWLSWGVKPAAVLGYSVGEYAAAAVAGVLGLEDALLLVARRAQWIEEMAEPGVMLAVPLTEPEIAPRLGDGLWVAAVNSPQATVVGGRPDASERLEAQLSESSVASRRVASDQGSHTPLLDKVRPHLRALAAGMRRETPQIPMLSNVTGSWLTAAEAQDPNHWCEHMCRTLRFEQGIGHLLENREQVLLEVGPGAGLSAMVRQHSLFGREMMSRVVSSLPGAWEKISDRENVTAVLGRLWVEGVPVDWESYFAGEDRRTISLPDEPYHAAGLGNRAGAHEPTIVNPDRARLSGVGPQSEGHYLGRDEFKSEVLAPSQAITGQIGHEGLRDSIELR
jgi:thioesterase domain-containing protein/malonyl CoA-acyl carrier protein transacylase/acyl carrier protein